MLNFKEKHRITGHLKIDKVWKDGTIETVFDDHNVIVSGMSVGLSTMFSLSGSQSITDFHLDAFQLGVCGAGVASPEPSGTYQLSGALTAIDQYAGNSSNLLVEERSQLIPTGVGKIDDVVFGVIPFSHVTRVNDTSVRYTIVLDEDACNDLSRPLDEIGLFMKNIFGRNPIESILVAYRKFTGIDKNDEFSLVFRWTINF